MWNISVADHLQKSQIGSEEMASSDPYSHWNARIPMDGVVPHPSQQDTFQDHSRQCFEASTCICENLGKTSPYRDKLVTKIKHSKILPHKTIQNSYLHAGCSESMLGNPHHYQHRHHEWINQQQQQHLASNDREILLQDAMTSSSTPATNFSSPYLPSSCSSSSDILSMPNNTNISKKHRYNQTALALQQSGLMVTTIKTAELLRKSKILQQELTQLRRETSMFLHSVLNNPQNKDMKETYLKDNGNM